MGIWRWTALACALVLGRLALAATAPPGRNAATYYEQAFQQLPHEAAELEIYKKWDEVPLDAKTLELFKRCGPSLQVLHRGSQLQACDWQWDYSKKLALQLPELNQARLFSQATALYIRVQCEQKQYAEAVDSALDLADVWASLRSFSHE